MTWSNGWRWRRWNDLRAKAKPRKKKWRLRPGPILLIGLISNCVVGVYSSPINSLAKVRVVGAPEADQERIASILKNLHDRPWAQVHTTEVESLALAGEELESASYTQNLFARGLLKLSTKQPVARLASNRSLLLSSKGSLYLAKAEIPDQLPTLKLPPKNLGVNLSLASTWEMRNVANLCQLLREKLPPTLWSIEIDGRSVLYLLEGSGAKVVLGSSKSSGEKLDKLSEILQKEPAFFKKVKEVNLTAPSHPVYIPK